MTKPIKAKVISARVETDLHSHIMTYCEQAEIDISDLIRLGVEQFIRKHPIKVEE